MFLSGMRYKQGATASLGLILSVLFFCMIAGVLTAETSTSSAMRSRVYGFRNTDNKEAMQLTGRLGFKVTIDAHSSSVVVITGDDPEELTRAYTVMTIADQKEPVVLKVLASIPDSQAQEVIDTLHSQLKTSNIGTLLNPPAKAAADPLVVDVYQGELIVIAAESQIGKIEEAYKVFRNKGSSQKTEISEPNVSAPVSPDFPKSVEPNTPETPVAVAKPDIVKPLPEPGPQQTKQVAPEPNKPVIQEMPAVQPAVAAVVSETVEPNEIKSREPQTQEDFMSNELLKTLDAEEKKMEVQKAASIKTPVETPETETPSPATKEITGDEFKKIIAQLMKQAAEEEKKTQPQQAASTEPQQPPQKADLPEPDKEASKPALSEEPNKSEKMAEPKIPVRTKPSKTPAAVKPETAAAEAKPQTDKGEEELELTITLPEKVEIKQLIELVGKQLGLNYVYDETKITGNVTLKVHDGKIKVKDVYTLLETVLRYKGFVMTRRGNLVTIVPNAELTFSDPKIRTPDEPIEAGDVYINSIFTFKHAKSATVQNILSQLGLGTRVIPIPESNSLIVTDYSYRMEKIDQIIRILDVPGIPKTFTYRSLKYMQASELIPRLQTLAAQMQNLTITSDVSSPAPLARPTRSPQQQQQPGQPAGQPVPPGAPQLAPVQSAPQQEQTVYLDADERTNRILMIGNEEQLKTVNDLIDSLDIRQQNLRYVKEYEIKNVDASEVINVLNELGLANVAGATAGSGQSTRQTTPQLRQPAQPGQPPQPGVPQQQPRSAATAQGSATTDQPSVSIRPNTNSLLVNATVEQHEDIELVISHIDVEQKDQRTIKEYEIQNVDAREIVQTLGDLSIISKNSVSNITSSKSSMYDTGGYGSYGSYGSSGSRMGRSGRPGYPSQQQYPQQGMGQTPEGGQEQSNVVSLPTASGDTIRELITTEPQISILETTNSLLIYATPRQHASVALVIAHVDRELSATTAPYVVYPLENQDPEELADTLTSLIEGTVKQKRTTSVAGQTQQPGGMGPMPMDNRIRTEQTESNLPKKEEERITIIPDVKSYSIIVYANKKNQQWVATLIKQLDQYRPQVLLDCTLVEINKDDQFAFDLDVISRKGGLNNGASMSTITNPITGNKTITDTHGTVLEGAFSSASESPFSAFYGDDNIQALLTAIDKKSYGRVLARPSVLVKDNEEGVIKSEKITYVAELTANTTAGGAGVDPIQTQNVNFKDYKAGITLTITPHIASEKLMQLEIELDRTDFIPGLGVTKIGDTTYPKPLDTTSSNVKTWSILPSGATIILGGIETVNQNKSNTKVPILGDIPLIGLLFRGIGQTDIQSKLYIFVKANIVKPGDELTGQSDVERISQKKRQAFEDDEARFQGLDSVPGLKPNPVHPKTVLEDDEYIQKLREQGTQSRVITIPAD